MYKLLAKVLSRRLEGVMEEVISNSQCAFVRGWQIIDCSFIAKEAVDEWRKNN